MNTEIIKQGTKWEGRTYDVQGGWSIENRDGALWLVLADDFETIQGPDLKFYLAQPAMADIGDRDSVDQTGELITILEVSRGAQEFPLPAGVDITAYKSIVLHCQAFSVVWGGFDL